MIDTAVWQFKSLEEVAEKNVRTCAVEFLYCHPGSTHALTASKSKTKFENVTYFILSI